MAKKKNNSTVDRRTKKRTIRGVREVVTQRLASMNKSKLWLAGQIGVRPATIYDFLGGKGVTLDTLEKIMGVLGLEIRPKPDSAPDSKKGSVR